MLPGYMTEEPHVTALGPLLKELRERRGLSQQEVAWDAEISVGALSRIECGRTSYPAFVTVHAITLALGLSLGQLELELIRS
jgi:transcriptional regulator with XRE-family HTH domain